MCHIGRTYCGVFGYADDLAIVSPTLFGLRQMIEICEEYASEMELLFNPKKSKLLCYNMLLDVKPVVYLCDAIVDVVDSEMYLGNKLYNNIYKTQIDELVCDFERRSNHIIHTFFSMCDSFTLKHLFSTYCESFYGCELFNFTKPYMSKLHISWRKIIRYIFRLSPRTHNYIVSDLGNCIIGRLYRRLCKYIYNLLHCENITVQQIVKCKLLSPTSIFADNYRYLCNKYNISHSDWYRDMPFITNMICTEYTNHQYDIFKTVTELCELRDGVAHCGVVNRTDICSLLEVLCTY